MNYSRPARIERDPAAADLLRQAAHQLFLTGQIDLAHPVARLALAIDGTSSGSHSVMAGILDALGEFGPALHHWREASRLMPDSPKEKVNLALALLGDGDWETGLPLYETRLDCDDWSSMAARGSVAAVRDRIPRPNTPLRGRHVLAISEQGLGDTIWSARFLAPLAARCLQLTVATSTTLRPVLERIDGPTRIIVPPEKQTEARINLLAPTASYDHVVPMMSLPWLLGSRPDAAESGRVPYLSPNRGSVSEWRRRYREAMPGVRRIVGLIWRANPTGPIACARSIPIRSLVPFAEARDIGFVNLQGGDAEGRLALAEVLPNAMDALGESHGRPALDQFAAAIAATDLLVSVDTLGAHLAGAMAHPGIVMLPTAPAFGFFWGHHGDRSAWYPSLRLIRQRHRGDWTDPVMVVRGWFDAPQPL